MGWMGKAGLGGNRGWEMGCRCYFFALRSGLLIGNIYREENLVQMDMLAASKISRL
jgi:hypothetical protein